MDLVSRRGMTVKPQSSSALPNFPKMSNWEFIEWYLARSSVILSTTPIPFVRTPTPVQKLSVKKEEFEVCTPVQRESVKRLVELKPSSQRRSARLEAKSPKIGKEDRLSVDYIHGHEYKEGRLFFWIVKNVNEECCVLRDGEEIQMKFPTKVQEYQRYLTRKTPLPLLEKDQRGRRRAGAYSPYEQW